MFQLGDDQNVDILVQPTDDANEPVEAPGGAMTYETDDAGALVELTPRVANGEQGVPDGTFVLNVKALGGLGTVTLTATHTASDGEQHQGTIELQVLPTAETGVQFTPRIPVHN